MDNYYIRLGKRKTGPFTFNQLSQQRAMGRLTPGTLVSTDRVHWVPAEQVEGLFPVADPVVELEQTESVVHSPPRISIVLRTLKRTFGARTWLFTCVVLAATVTAAFAIHFLQNMRPAYVVQSHADEANITSAIGFVVCGRRHYGPSGIKEKPESYGSGFLVTPDGYLITNRHVVSGVHQELQQREKLKQWELLFGEAFLRVYVNEIAYDADVVYVSEKYDLAVLKVDRPAGSCFHISGTAPSTRNDNVYAIGFPSGAQEEIGPVSVFQEDVRKAMSKTIRDYFSDDDFSHSQTAGNVARVEPKPNIGVLVQHTATINQGNSGGPLILENGLVAGINSFGYQAKDIYYALDIQQLKAELDLHVPGITWE